MNRLKCGKEYAFYRSGTNEIYSVDCSLSGIVYIWTAKDNGEIKYLSTIKLGKEWNLHENDWVFLGELEQ